MKDENIIRFPSQPDPEPESPQALMLAMKFRRTSVVGIRLPLQLRLHLQGRADQAGRSLSSECAIVLLSEARRQIREHRKQEAAAA